MDRILKGIGELRGLLDHGVEIVDRLLVLAKLEVHRAGEPGIGSSGFALSAASAACKATAARSFVVGGAAAAATLRSIRVTAACWASSSGTLRLTQIVMEDGRASEVADLCQTPQ